MQRAVLASRGGGELYIDTVKSKRARTVPLVAELVPVIDRWAEGKAADRWLFPAPAGGPLRESNIDLVLSALLWEEGKWPEDAAREFDRGDSALKRLRHLVAPRLGGNWDLTRVPELAQWREKVAESRNTIVHGGELPSRWLAREAIDAMYGFFKYTLDRMCSDTARTRYPMMALLLGRRTALEARGKWTSGMRAAADEADELSLQAVFGLWHSATSELRRPEHLRSKPSGEATPVLCRLADGRDYWCEHDRIARLARLADPPVNEAKYRRTVKKLDRNIGRTISFDAPPSLRSAGSWLPEHRLIPPAAVMRDPHLWAIPPDAPSA